MSSAPNGGAQLEIDLSFRRLDLRFMFTTMALLASVKSSEGALLLAGGGSTTPEMVQTFIQAIGGPDQPILVVPLMRERADEAGRQSADFLREYGAKNVDVFLEVEYLPLNQAATRARFLRAKGLWLPGGDQGLFMQRLGSSFAKDLFQLAHRRGISVFGTSAGAMLMSDPMIDGWEDDTRPKRSPGLGLIPVLVDTHYRERERQGRLRFAFENWNSHTRALGLSEGEWILWQGGRVRQSSGRPEWLGSPALPQGTGRRKVQI